jgi:8-oxo-dGTP pyrophosphatase MutT (NUDIX family)
MVARTVRATGADVGDQSFRRWPPAGPRRHDHARGRLGPAGQSLRGPDGVVYRAQRRPADHPGQISFPGGRIEPEDADAVAAALREAEEEIALPRDRVQPLGRLADYETVTGYRVTPVVGWVEPPIVLKPDPVEVASVFEVPLAFLLEPGNQKRHFRMQGLVRRDFWAIPFGERYIWGATAAMLRILDRTLRAE